jgi:tyrosine-protein kinase Etk/Wzc
MAPPTNVEMAGPVRPMEAEITLADLIPVLAKRKFLISAVTLLAMAVTAVVVLLVPPSYTAESVILPPQPEQSTQSLFMGPLAGMTGASLLGGAAASTLWRNPADLYIGILKSRTIADALIARFHLQQVYRKKTLIDTRKVLARHSTIASGKESLIRIEVEDHSPQRAAQMADAYVEELYQRNSRLALTSASQRRLFFQQQIEREKEALSGAEVAMKNTQQSSGLVVPSGQSEALIRSVAQMRAEIAIREVQLESMRSYATSENPQVLLLEREAKALRDQLEKLQAGSGAGGDFVVPVRNLPAASLEYLRKMRDLQYHQALFELVSKQYEAARIDEARSAPLIQVVDRAVAPDKKSWPPRTLFVLGAGLLGFLAACFVVLIQSRPKAER